MTTPPNDSNSGWHRDPSGRHEHRFYDGQAWTEHVANAGVQSTDPVHTPPADTDAVPVSTSYAPAVVTSDTARPWFRKKRWWAIGLVGLIAVIAAAASESDDGGSDDAGSTESFDEIERDDEAEEMARTTVPTDATAAPITVAPAPTEPPVTEAPVPEETASQRNAVRKAEDYLDFSAFSRNGLIEQLEFEGFPPADATYAVDKVNPDWFDQAAKKADSYLEFSAFSRQGLIDQLVFEGFTPEQAEHGAASAGL